jgi:hypothetical protein
MQLQSLMIMMFMLIVLPIFVLFADHTTFFIVIALLLFSASLKNLREQIKGLHADRSQSMDEDNEEIDERTEKEIRTFEKGIVVIKNLMMILFFIYCLFFSNSLWLQLITSAVILYWLRDLAVNLLDDPEDYTEAGHPLSKAVYIVVNLCTLGLVLIAAYNRFFPSGI